MSARKVKPAAARRLSAAQMEAIGFTWALACDLLDKGVDPRTYEVPRVAEEAALRLEVQS